MIFQRPGLGLGIGNGPVVTSGLGLVVIVVVVERPVENLPSKKGLKKATKQTAEKVAVRLPKQRPNSLAKTNPQSIPRRNDGSKLPERKVRGLTRQDSARNAERRNRMKPDRKPRR